MNEKLQQFEDWINTLSVRERLLVVLGAIAVVFLIWDQSLVTPLEKKAKLLGDQVRKQQDNLKIVRAQQEEILARAGQDPNKTIQKEMQAINNIISKLDSTLQDMTVDLIDPQQMAVVLEEMLNRQSALKVVRVEARVPQSLGEQLVDSDVNNKQADAETEVVPGIYKHTLEIEFIGSYMATLDYIKQLEALQRRFYWGSVDYEVKDYPKARVIIRVNTLSLNDAWIGV